MNNKYKPPVDKALNLVLEDDRPLKIIDAPRNISAAIIRLQAFENRFLYIVNFWIKISLIIYQSQKKLLIFIILLRKEAQGLRFLYFNLCDSCEFTFIYFNNYCYKIFIKIC